MQTKHGDVPVVSEAFWWVQPTQPAVAAHLAQHAAESRTGPVQSTCPGLLHTPASGTMVNLAGHDGQGGGGPAGRGGRLSSSRSWSVSPAASWSVSPAAVPGAHEPAVYCQ